MAMALEAGDLVDQKYRIVRFIGRGAWASVYEGVNARIGRRVAIKVLSDEAIQKPGIVERFEREAQAATRIESPHVVHVFDLGVLPDGRPYIVMELLEGSNLGQALNERGSMSEGRAVFYTIQALRGLAEAHSAGVMHRDIKPDNMVLVTTKHGEEILKIVDFGISKLQSGLQQASNMTQTNTVLGSPVYMSPEQCRGTKHMDHRSDLYSLGVVLFELLTGQVPHKGDTFNELMFKIALEDTPSPATIKDDLDPDLCAIVMKALRRDPLERFQSAIEFEQALFGWANTHAIDTTTWFERGSRLHITGEAADGTLTSSSQRRTAAAAAAAQTELSDSKKVDFSGGTLVRSETTGAIEPTSSAITNPGAAVGTTVGTTTDMAPFPARKRGWIWGAGGAAAVVVVAAVLFVRLSSSHDPTVRPPGSSGSLPDPTGTGSMAIPVPPIPTNSAGASPSATVVTTATAPPTPTETQSVEPPPTPTPSGLAARPNPPNWGRRPVPPPATSAHPSAVASSAPPPPAPPTTAPAPSGNSIVDGRRIRTDL